MQHHTVLRLLLAGFFLYFSWPFIPQATLPLEIAFWGVWLAFLLLVIGGNLATLLQLTEPPVMEQRQIRERKTYKH